jgi:hypothetical protein
VEIQVQPGVVVRGEDNNWTKWVAFYQAHKAKIWGAVWAIIAFFGGSGLMDDVLPGVVELKQRVSVVERDVEQLKAAVFVEVDESELGEETEE